MFDILIKNIKGLVQVRTEAYAPVAGAAMAGLPIVTDGFLAIKDGVIAALGSMDQLPSGSALQIIDAAGRFVLPAFVDSHTHLVFAASREENSL